MENKINEISFSVSHFEISVIHFIERSFEQLDLINPQRYYTIEEFNSLIRERYLSPFTLNQNQIKMIIIQMTDLRILECERGEMNVDKYRYKQNDLLKSQLYLTTNTI